MTVLENFRNKSVDELIDWLDEYCTFDTALWHKWFDKNYCSKCQPIEAINDSDYEMDYGYCELNKNCRFFQNMDDVPDNKQIIKMWLESECD